MSASSRCVTRGITLAEADSLYLAATVMERQGDVATAALLTSLRERMEVDMPVTLLHGTVQGGNYCSYCGKHRAIWASDDEPCDGEIPTTEEGVARTEAALRLSDMDKSAE